MDDLPPRTRFAIVGGGVAGLSTAWALAEAGEGDVVVLEREPSVAAHASGKNAAMCRALAEDDPWTSLTARGAAWLREPPAGFADRPLVDGRGSVLLTHDVEVLAARAARHGLRVSPVDAPEVARRWPGVQVDRGGLWCPDDGCIDLAALIGGYAGGARRRGVRIVTGVEVASIELGEGSRDGGRGVRIETSRGWIEAEAIVMAAGAWAGELAARAGVHASFVARRRHVFALVAAAGDAPILWNLDGDEWYVRAAGDGLWACACDHVPSAPGDVAVDPSVEALLRARLPAALRDAPLARVWACQRTFAPEGTPRIGWDPTRPSWCWVAGLGGHGITASAEIGRRAATQLLHARPY